MSGTSPPLVLPQGRSPVPVTPAHTRSAACSWGLPSRRQSPILTGPSTTPPGTLRPGLPRADSPWPDKARYFPPYRSYSSSACKYLPSDIRDEDRFMLTYRQEGTVRLLQHSSFRQEHQSRQANLPWPDTVRIHSLGLLKRHVTWEHTSLGATRPGRPYILHSLRSRTASSHFTCHYRRPPGARQRRFSTLALGKFSTGDRLPQSPSWLETDARVHVRFTSLGSAAQGQWESGTDRHTEEEVRLCAQYG